MALLLALIFAIGGVICHQRPERSFFLDGHQLPVCARCTGLYASALVGLVGWFAVKAARSWARSPLSPRVVVAVLAIAAVPTALSVAGAATGIADGNNFTRALLAVPLGASAGAVVAAVVTKDLR